MKRGRAAVTICSSAFESLGRAQAGSLGCADLPIALVPHPFGLLKRSELFSVAEDAAEQIFRLIAIDGKSVSAMTVPAGGGACEAHVLSVTDDVEALHRMFCERGWSDGLPVVPPTVERVKRMLSMTQRPHDEVVATVAPAFGAATVGHIAINAVMAGCAPFCIDLLIAAVEAVAAPEFNLQGIQATTNPAAVWIIANGPVAGKAGITGGVNCLGQGPWGNVAVGRALRLILQNIGGALPGTMDRATHGQPGKISMCCAENEVASPWASLHVDRGYAPKDSTVTVVGFSGTLNMNTHSKNANEILRSIADAMAHAPSNDYWCGGEPWIALCPEHAAILSQAGYSKTDVQRRLWELSLLRASRMADKDYERTARTRRAELGEITPDTLLPIAPEPDRIGLIVAGGAGTHAVYMPGFGNSRSVTRRVDCAEVVA